jgi:isoleucyl-tRNA synthetase
MTEPVLDDFKDTLFLPNTAFPMRGELPKREPETVQKWRDMDLYKKLTERPAPRGPFVLHFGPPFANGAMHAGHALTKILKDMVVRTRFALGYNAAMIPGWDCHGLPIEWKVEEKYRKENKNKDDVPAAEFLRECRAFADYWIGVQSNEIQRLGVTADWDAPYKTMDFASEATIAAEMHKFLMKGMLKRGVRPVLWSVVEKTALAAAEVEYEEHTSTTVFVAFPVTKTPRAELNGASVVIWTTTPWTLPGNRAIAFGADIDYGLYEVIETLDGSIAKVGQKLLLCNQTIHTAILSALKVKLTKHSDYKGADLTGVVCAHPFASLDKYYTFDVPLLAGDFVTIETGTGFVHIAPGHGEDDYHLGRANKIEVPETVDGDGTYYPDVGLFAGIDVYDQNGKEGKATGAIIGKLVSVGALLAKGKLRHSYPHSWRSKAPLIFRTTPQWFIALDDEHNLRGKALKAIKDTKWIPAEGQNRIEAMVQGRADWCVSRQRMWGVPLGIFVNKKTREPLRDDAVNARIVEAIKQDGVAAWRTRGAAYFLGDAYNPDDYDQLMDIVDVWFESGTTHAFVLKQPDSAYPIADLYLEGSDQHRGWFQSSLLVSCGTRGVAPYKTVLTHGFVVDKDGKKMSKSLGNGITMADLMDQYGSDITRMWVLSANYHDDVRLGHEALKLQSELYRRFRNTLRYILGNLDGFTAAERVDLNADYTKLPDLEKFILHRVTTINDMVKKHVMDYKFHEAFKEIYDFCNGDLSAFYFDIRKDRLYCDTPVDFDRRATRSVLEVLLGALTMWLAPFLPFTAEEAWTARPSEFKWDNDCASVHLRHFADWPATWKNDTLVAQWDALRAIRRVVTGAIELERAEKRIGSSLEAHPTIYLENTDMAAFANVDWAELTITSAATVVTKPAPQNAYRLDGVAGVGVIVQKAAGQKCARSWKILSEVGADTQFPNLSKRDADAVRWYRKTQKEKVA